MKRAGCKYMFVGIESGSSRILEMIDKSQTLGGVEKGIRLIKKHGTRVIESVVIGFPTETKDDIKKTVSLVLSLPLNGLPFFIYTPFPKTPLYDFACKHGDHAMPSWLIFYRITKPISVNQFSLTCVTRFSQEELGDWIKGKNHI